MSVYIGCVASPTPSSNRPLNRTPLQAECANSRASQGFSTPGLRISSARRVASLLLISVPYPMDGRCGLGPPPRFGALVQRSASANCTGARCMGRNGRPVRREPATKVRVLRSALRHTKLTTLQALFHEPSAPRAPAARASARPGLPFSLGNKALSLRARATRLRRGRGDRPTQPAPKRALDR